MIHDINTCQLLRSAATSARKISRRLCGSGATSLHPQLSCCLSLLSPDKNKYKRVFRNRLVSLFPHLFYRCRVLGGQRAGQRQDCVKIKPSRTSSRDRHVYLHIKRVKFSEEGRQENISSWLRQSRSTAEQQGQTQIKTPVTFLILLY